MKLVAVVWLAGMAAGLSGAQGCCSTSSDCTDQLSTADIEYNSRYGKTLECDQGCPGLVNCNMFGICEQCRGCFETCEGAMMYMEETSAPAEFITFCSGVGIADLSECDGDAVASGDGSGSGSTSSGAGSGSGAGSASSGDAFGSGTGSASSGDAHGSGAGSGSGSNSLSGEDGASASGLDSASVYGDGSGSGGASVTGGGSTSASGLDSATGTTSEAYGTGEGSGGASMSSGMVSASGSGDASRVAVIEGCDCGTAELEPSFAAYFCENQKSMYCDLECVDDPDSADALFPSLGGLWCQPEGWQGCRMCKFDCSDYEGDCVPCPAGLRDWCE